MIDVLLKFCHNVVGEILSNATCELNDTILRAEIEVDIMQILDKIKVDVMAIDEITEVPFAISCTCDNSNNTPNIIDNNQLIVDVEYIASIYYKTRKFQYILRTGPSYNNVSGFIHSINNPHIEVKEI